MNAIAGPAMPSSERDFPLLWLMKEGHTPDEIALMLGSTARWVRTMVQRWNRAGEQALLDRRRTLPGARPLLSIEQQKQLDHALDQPPADGGLWSGPKVAAWMPRALRAPSRPSSWLGLLAAAGHKHARAPPTA
jgi:hypothetical protein